MEVVFTLLSLLKPAFSLDETPADLTIHLRSRINAPLLLYAGRTPHRIHEFGTMLEPRYIVGAKPFH